MEDITVKAKIDIAEHELQLWKNTAYQFELRARIAKRAENKDMQDNATLELEKATKLIIEIEKELTELKKEV